MKVVFLILILVCIINYFFIVNQINFTDSNFNTIFQIYYINIEKRKDRNDFMIHEFLKLKNKDYNFNTKRVDAVVHAKGAIGCGKSHIKCLELAKSNNLDYVIIMEDDIIIQEELINSYFNKIKTINDWDVIILSGHGKKRPIDDKISNALEIQTTGMYIVNKHYYDTLIKNFQTSVSRMNKQLLKKKKINYHKYAIDKYWIKLQKKDNWYVFNKSLGYQKPGYSNIQKKNVNYKNHFK